LVIYGRAHCLEDYDSIYLHLNRQQTVTTDEIYVAGEIDITNIEKLDSALQESILSGSSEAVVVDMRDVGFIGVVAIRSLLRAYEAAEEHGKKFCLQNPSRVTQRLLDLAGLKKAVAVQFIAEDNQRLGSFAEQTAFKIGNEATQLGRQNYIKPGHS